MRRFCVITTSCCSVLCVIALTACNPIFNWREVRADGTELIALLPCKPDQASRPVVLAGRRLDLQVMGCDAGGATFAVSHARLAEAGSANDVLADWRLATLSNMHAVAPRQADFVLKGATTLTSSVQTVAVGRRADGLPVMAHAAWFAKGDDVFSAVIYADRLSPEVAEAFFSGLTFK